MIRELFRWRWYAKHRDDAHRAARYQVEALESRTLLAGDLIAAVGATLYPGTPGDPYPGLYPVAPGSQAIIEGYVERAASNPLEENKSHIPTGSLIFQWYGGGVLATVPVTAVLYDNPAINGGFIGYSLVERQTVTLDPANAGTEVARGTHKGAHILMLSYTGGGGFAPVLSTFSAADFEVVQDGGGALGAYLIEFTGGPTTGPETHIDFLQQPNDAVPDEPIDPAITVQVLDSQGHTVESSNTIISLALSGGDGTATLSGTTQATLVDGIATFGDITVDKPGEYQLIATSSSGLSQPIYSSTFDIAAGKLVFKKPPTTGGAGDPLKPIVVELRDGNNDVVTSDNETVVTLNPIGFNADAPIEGNVATVVNGVATFDNLILKRPGSYELQASGGASVVATSKKFKITGGKLAITKQPTFVDVNAPIDLTVTVKTANGKLDTDATTFAQLTLVPVDPASTATLGGTFVVPFIGGIATFGGDGGAFVDAPGKYAFTVTEVQESLGSYINAETSTPIDTKQFQVGGYTLTFNKQPAAVDVDKRLTFAVAQVDPKKKVNKKLNSHHVQLTLNVVAGGVDAQVSAFENVGFAAGLQAFTGGQAPSIDVPGTYTFTATEVDANGDPITTTAPVTSKPFKVSGYHIVFLKKPGPSTAGVPIKMKVAIADARGKVDTTQNEAVLSFDAMPVGGGDAAAGASSATFVNGVVDFLSQEHDALGPGQTDAFVNAVGKFTLKVGATVAGRSAGYIEPATSKVVDVARLRLSFLESPQNETVDHPMDFRVGIHDRFGDRVRGLSGVVKLTTSVAEVGVSQLKVWFDDDGLVTYSPTASAAAIDTPGTYRLTATVLTGDFEDSPVDDRYLNAISKPFKVLPVRLAFTIPPVGTPLDLPLPPFQVGYIDADGEKLDPPYALANIQITYRLTTDSPMEGTELAVVTMNQEGLASFSLLFLPERGRYILTATDLSQGPNDVPIAPIQSAVIRIV